jgi:hypothetical protein
LFAGQQARLYACAADKAAMAAIAGRKNNGTKAPSCLLGIPRASFADAIARATGHDVRFADTLENVNKGPLGKRGIIYEPLAMTQEALALEVRARQLQPAVGKRGSATMGTQREALELALNGDKCVPAIGGTQPADVAAALRSPTFCDARLGHDPLHDFKGLMAMLYALIFHCCPNKKL